MPCTEVPPEKWAALERGYKTGGRYRHSHPIVGEPGGRELPLEDIRHIIVANESLGQSLKLVLAAARAPADRRIDSRREVVRDDRGIRYDEDACPRSSASIVEENKLGNGFSHSM